MLTSVIRKSRTTDRLESEQTVKLQVYLGADWWDEFLVWDPSKYNGTESVALAGNRIWNPPLTVLNSLETNQVLSDELITATITHTGHVAMSTPYNVHLLCPMDIAPFPFDTQSCTIDLALWSTDINKAEIMDSIREDRTSSNTEWTMEHPMKVTEYFAVSDHNNTYKDLYFTFRIHRLWSYYVFVLMLPTFLIATLCITGIFLPSTTAGAREEKVTLGLTTLLTMGVMLNIVSGEMPKGTGLPILGYFVMVEMAICVIGLVTSIVIMKVHHELAIGGKVAPGWLKRIFCIGRGPNRLGAEDKKNAISVVHVPTKEGELSALREAFVPIQVLLSRIDHRLADHQFDQNRLNEWELIFSRFDLLLFVIFQSVDISLCAFLLTRYCWE